jgi:hypothetical protein
MIWLRVKIYLVTLWMALRGDPLVPIEDLFED